MQENVAFEESLERLEELLYVRKWRYFFGRILNYYKESIVFCSKNWKKPKTSDHAAKCEAIYRKALL